MTAASAAGSTATAAPRRPSHRARLVTCRPGRRGVVGLKRRVEQGAEAALAGGVVAPDGGVVSVEVGPYRGEADAPAGPPAVPAEDGGEGALLRRPTSPGPVSSPSSLHR